MAPEDFCAKYIRHHRMKKIKAEIAKRPLRKFIKAICPFFMLMALAALLFTIAIVPMKLFEDATAVEHGE